ncbi:AarF/UbiB family protein [Sorangium cellulosum]|uniref:Protein kinase domain-containing protein n=1 Tax=Sorangium cellulosum So0157-2 TaxID=1254432 RepID=S4XMD2_SORCE|nr:AarF/UbiB family protein [Sorangium cellulosum]AGP33714.1 hypothetical protein SCE1572_03910 [Sorangium cellulosum So0157-2]
MTQSQIETMAPRESDAAARAGAQELLRNRQEMLALSYIAYVGLYGLAAIDVARMFLLVQRFLNDLAPVRDRWKIVWGPGVANSKFASFIDDRVVFVVEHTKEKNRFAVVIRGTNPLSIANISEVNDIFEMIDWPYGKPAPGLKPKISRGIDNGLEQLVAIRASDELPGSGKSLIEFLKERVARARGAVRIDVTGHSLGGALAGTLALCLTDLQGTDEVPETLRWDPDRKARVWATTIAAIPAGDPDFAAHSDAQLDGRCDRVANSLDIVPYTGIASEMGIIRHIYEPTVPTGTLISLSFDNVIKRLTAEKLVYQHACRDAVKLEGTVRKGGDNFVAEMLYQHVDAYVHLLDLTDAIDIKTLLSASPDDMEDDLSQEKTANGASKRPVWTPAALRLGDFGPPLDPPASLLPAKHTPTPLATEGHQKLVEIYPVSKPSRFRALYLIYRTIVYLLHLLPLRNRPFQAARLTRVYLENLGGIWIKLGQVLSMRTDLFSNEFCEELANLQERSFGFPTDVARRIIDDCLGHPLEQTFDVFEEVPVAAASLSQVHKARLRKNGVWVAIKVQKPYAREYFQKDFSWISFLFRTFDRLGIGEQFGWKGMLNEVKEVIEDELDYRHELAAIRDIRRTLKKHKIYVPRPFDALCNDRVLVMEFIHGVSVAEYIRVNRADPERARKWCEENNISCKKVAKTLCHSLLRQMFEDNLCHGDIHPGNVVMLRNSRIAFLDFGTVGSFDTEFIAAYRLYLTALASQNFSEAVDLMLWLSGELPVIDIQVVRFEVISAMRSWYARTRRRSLPVHQRSLASSSDEVGKILMRYRMRVNWSMLKLGRTYHTLDMTIGAVYPKVNYPKLLKSYYAKATRRANQRALTALAGLPQRLGGYASIVLPRFRERLFVFMAGRSIIEEIIISVGALLRFLLVVLAAALGLVYLRQHHPELAAQLFQHEPRLLHAIDMVPYIAPGYWAVLAIVVFIMIVKHQRLLARTKRQPVRLPGGQGSSQVEA